MKTNRSSPSDSDSGQYLVEFSLSFVVFMLFVLFVIDMGLMIYNHHVFYHGVYVGARTASLGAGNDEIRSTVGGEVVPNYFPTLFMRAHPDTGVDIRPEDEVERVEGTSVTVSMDATVGISLLGLYVLTLEVPVSSRELIVADNDEDRDGCKDSREGAERSCRGYSDFSSTFPRDHDNDGRQDEYVFNGADADADNDGIRLRDETVEVAYFQNPPTGDPAFAINRRTSPAGPTVSVGGTKWETSFDGRYHAPVLWSDGTQADPQNFARSLPRWQVDNSADTAFKRTLFSGYDADNDGWEDKYDQSPTDPGRH